MNDTQLNPQARLREAIKGLNDLILAPGDTPEYIAALEAKSKEVEDLKAAADAYSRAANLAAADYLVSGDASKGLRVLQSPDGNGIAIADEEAERFADLKAVREPSYSRAFGRFLRGIHRMDKHDLGVLEDVNKKAMQVGIDTAGGFLVPPDRLGEIISRRAHPTDVVNQVRRISTARDRMQIPIQRGGDNIYSSGLRYQFVGETGTTAEDTSLENWGQIEIAVHEATMDVRLTRTMTEDAEFDVEAYVLEQVASAHMLELERYTVSTAGTGIGRPTGMLTAVGTGNDEYVTENVGNPITGDGIMALEAALPHQYRQNGTFVMNSGSVYRTVSQLKAGSTDYIGFVSGLNDSGLAGARQLRLLGYRVALSAFMPDVGATNRVLMFGDLAQAYALVERTGMIARPYGDGDAASLRSRQVGVVINSRFGGGPLLSQALRVGVQS